MEVEIDDTTKEARKESDEEVKEGEKSSEQSAVELKKKELPYEILSNPARATWQQQKLLSYSKKQRYVPVKPVSGVTSLTPKVLSRRRMRDSLVFCKPNAEHSII